MIIEVTPQIQIGEGQPLLSPSLFFCSTMTMIGAFQVFVQPLFLTQGGPGETQVSDFYRVLESLRNTKGFHHVHLARGTRAFTPAGLLGGLAGLLS